MMRGAAVLLLLVLAGCGGAQGSKAGSIERDKVARSFLEKLQAGDDHGAASMFGFPDHYSAEERSEEIGNIATSLKIVRQEFGALQDITPGWQRDLLSFVVRILAGDIEHLQKEGPDVTQRFSARSERYSEVLLEIDLIFKDKWLVRGAAFGLEQNAANARHVQHVGKRLIREGLKIPE